LLKTNLSEAKGKKANTACTPQKQRQHKCDTGLESELVTDNPKESYLKWFLLSSKLWFTVCLQPQTVSKEGKKCCKSQIPERGYSM